MKMINIKLILNVRLIPDSNVKIEIVTLIHNHTKNFSSFINTDNDWSIYYGNDFHLGKLNFMILPKTKSKKVSTLRFNNDDERKEYLNQLSLALLYWSESHNTGEPRIIFKNNIWTIH